MPNNFQANVFVQNVLRICLKILSRHYFYNYFNYNYYHYNYYCYNYYFYILRQKYRLLITQNYFNQEISFSYFLIKILQSLRQVFIFHIFTWCSFVYFGSIVLQDFQNFQIFTDNKVHNHKVKKSGTTKTFKH